MMGLLGATWGVTGVLAVLAFAVYRLSGHAWAALTTDLTALQWAALAVNVVFMGWSEGYRGFHQRFSPRVAARVFYLRRHPSPLHALLAPLFCVGFFHANRRTVLGVWIGTAAIVMLVLLVHRLGQPWRGILDAGVVVGLSWGIVSFAMAVFATFRSGDYWRPPDVPRSVPEFRGAARRLGYTGRR